MQHAHDRRNEEHEPVAYAPPASMHDPDLWGNAFANETIAQYGALPSDVASAPLLDAAGAEGSVTASAVPPKRRPIDRDYPDPPTITKPTAVDGRLGRMTVYPDDWQGELPKGAVREAQHRRMSRLVQDVETGQGQVTIDTSSFTAGIDPAADPKGYAAAKAKGDAFKKQHLGYLVDLVKTPTGLAMMETLSGTENATRIQPGSMNGCKEDVAEDAVLDENGRRGDGTGNTITMDPSSTTFYDPKQKRYIGEVEEPWMTERQKYGFYHELVHAYHHVRGDAIPGGIGIAKTELQTVGRAKTDAAKQYDAGLYPDERVSENAIRRDMGKAERPEY